MVYEKNYRSCDGFSPVRVAPLSVFLLLLGCATGTASNPFTENTPRDGYQLRIVSRNDYDVTVYIDPGEGREVLTTMRPRSIEFLEFQYPMGRPLRLEVESIVGDRYRVPPGSSIGGGRVDLVIPANIRRTVLTRGTPDSGEFFLSPAPSRKP